MRHAVSLALLLSAFGLPLPAADAAARTETMPLVQLSVTIAAVTDPDLAAARVTPRMVPIDQVMVSSLPWGEARVEHFELQVISGKDALRLLTALSKAPSMGKPSLDTVPSGVADRFMRSESIRSAPTSPLSIEMLHQSREFFLRPSVNADGTITLSFAFKELPAVTSKPSPSEGAEESKASSATYTEIGQSTVARQSR
ncbi:MAG: hypothetical protein ACRYFS_13725 [Janthinobacterium lividum]